MSLFINSTDNESDDDINNNKNNDRNNNKEDITNDNQDSESSIPKTRTTTTTRSSSTIQPKQLQFNASTTQITHLSEIFQCLLAINNQAIISIRPNGITLYSTYNYSTKVHMNIDPSLFNLYNITTNEEEVFDDDELKLGVDISLISDCFNSVQNTLKFESLVNCYITYNGEGYPLQIEFEDNYISEKLDFFTFYIDEFDDYNDDDNESNSNDIDYSNIILEIIVKSDVLTNLLQELNQIHTDLLFIYTSKNKLNFISSGSIGMSKLIFPNEKSILEKLIIDSDINPYIISQFKFNEFWKIFKSVKLSSKCKILKDSAGNFSIQLICKNNYQNQQSHYSGTLITFKMNEMIHNDYLVEWILQDELSGDMIIPVNDTATNNDNITDNNNFNKNVTFESNIPRLPHEPLINSFKKSNKRKLI
ncbi:RAD17 [Candida pseudojiufengensis]|uniref:RAD17 n=1 Tax=Candida pseudojiufengensis TaxID=497109 RepID=UPI002225AE0D|nr:RAD17 [Candida pseudojiufengensis]KAI5965633.1 RAD17 [Candida pseudojiufengensis]